MPAATVTSKGQLTIPKAIRDKFKLKTGDRVEFLEESGKIVMIPASVDLVALGSVLPPPRRHVSIEQMNRAIEVHAVRRFRRK
ncbi:MAG: AbrB/MazE/SpoVT family DNA-binding domain-containing protein [Candidatus Eremiobacteraeota bacterium]|nr:AbrB/MazE/SpoVT family DNA-binding domain-containing protein [Candidatus Eremiobacteraeota bacterium]